MTITPEFVARLPRPCALRDLPRVKLNSPSLGVSGQRRPPANLGVKLDCSRRVRCRQRDASQPTTPSYPGQPCLGHRTDGHATPEASQLPRGSGLDLSFPTIGSPCLLTTRREVDRHARRPTCHPPPNPAHSRHSTGEICYQDTPLVLVTGATGIGFQRSPMDLGRQTHGFTGSRIAQPRAWGWPRRVIEGDARVLQIDGHRLQSSIDAAAHARSRPSAKPAPCEFGTDAVSRPPVEPLRPRAPLPKSDGPFSHDDGPVHMVTHPRPHLSFHCRMEKALP